MTALSLRGEGAYLFYFTVDFYQRPSTCKGQSARRYLGRSRDNTHRLAPRQVWNDRKLFCAVGNLYDGARDEDRKKKEAGTEDSATNGAGAEAEGDGVGGRGGADGEVGERIGSGPPPGVGFATAFSEAAKPTASNEVCEVRQLSLCSSPFASHAADDEAPTVVAAREVRIADCRVCASAGGV